LGLLSFVTRSLAEQENLEFYQTMNTLTENPTLADIEQTIPGTPKIPNNIDAIITLLILNQISLVQVIGDKAPPATEIQRLIEALHDNYNRLTGITNFQGLISNEIVYQLCHHLERYFIVYCTEPTFGNAVFPNAISISSSKVSRTTISPCHTVTDQFLRQKEHHHESILHKKVEAVAVAEASGAATEVQHQLHENEQQQQQQQQKQPNQ
jgi:hypothetical protein